MQTKTRQAVFVAAVMAALIFIVQHLRRRPDDVWHGPSRSELARKEVLEECTNKVVGLNRIIALNLDDHGSNVSQWRAEATLEYVNSIGGVQRTNLNFRFEGFGSGIICLQD